MNLVTYEVVRQLSVDLLESQVGLLKSRLLRKNTQNELKGLCRREKFFPCDELVLLEKLVVKHVLYKANQ